MTRLQAVLVTLTTLITAKVGVAHGKCRFPDFLLRSNPWVGDYKDGQLIAYVHPTFLKVSESFDGGATEPFHKECVKRGPDGKFLVKQTERGHHTKYQCVQFLNRSRNIVQVKSSEWHDRQNMDICNEDKMKIDPYPWVQLDQDRDEDYVCPFVGGYNIYAYYPHPNNTMVCSNNRLLMRLESECERGGGIEFNFRKEYCVPKDLPRTPIQRAKCVANWSQGEYTFIILKHVDKPRIWWCLRTSDPLNDLKEAYLWLQVVCDASPIPDHGISQNYLKLGFERVVYLSTCADEIQVCAGATHACDANYKQHCALTCQQCRSEAEIGLCTFEEQYRGRWMDSGLNGDFLMDIETYTIRGGKVGTYNCLKLDDDVQEYKDKKVFLETYENGCLPRYACGEMSKVNSSVMQFRLGTRHVWPLPNPTSLMGRHRESQKEYICKDKNFQIHYRAESKYIKERPPRLLVDTENIKELPCGIPEQLQNGVSFVDDGRRCGGCLYYNPTSNLTRFIIRPENCHDNTTSPPPGPAPFQTPMTPITYSCMATFTFHSGVTSVITKRTFSRGGMGQYHMWNFVRNNQIKVMSASEAFVYQHNEHPKSEFIQAQFSILRQDKYKCRMHSYTTTTTTTTSTTTPNTSTTTHIIDGRRPGQGVGGNGKITYRPGNPDKITPYPTRSGNLRGGNGRSPASLFHCCDQTFYVMLFMTSLVIYYITSGHQSSAT